jgi:hypothetical protein
MKMIITRTLLIFLASNLTMAQTCYHNTQTATVTITCLCTGVPIATVSCQGNAPYASTCQDLYSYSYCGTANGVKCYGSRALGGCTPTGGCKLRTPTVPSLDLSKPLVLTADVASSSSECPSVHFLHPSKPKQISDSACSSPEPFEAWLKRHLDPRFDARNKDDPKPLEARR